MNEKEQQIYNYLTTNLDALSTFEDKHAFLTTKTFGTKKYTMDQIYTMFPDLKSQVADYMWNTVETQFGNPESKEFTFSKTISDNKLLSMIDTMGLNRESLVAKLKERNFSTDVDTAIDDINTLIEEKNERWQVGSDILNERRKAANTIWNEGEGFGKRVPLAFPLLLGAQIFGSPVEYIKRLGDEIKYGNENKSWTTKILDAFSRPGETTKVNWNITNYDSETGNWGYPEHYENATASLTDAYDNLDDIKYDKKYNDASALKPYVDEYTSLQKDYGDIITATGLDEALLYIEGENKLEQLKTILENR